MTNTVKQSALALGVILQADLKNITIPLLSGHSIKGRLTPTAMAWSGVPMTTSLAPA